MVDPPPLPDPDSLENPNVRRWRDVFENCEGGLRAFLRGRLGQEVDVDDCLQVVCVKMILQANKSDDDVLPAARRAWLFRVAANEAAALWRRKAATEKMIQRRGAADAAPNDVTEHLIRDETTAKLRRAVAALPQPMQQVVRLRIEENLTFQQIADATDEPLQTVASRYRRALERIQREVDGEP